MNVFDYEVLDTIREYQVSEGDFPSIFKGREEEALSSLKKISAYGLVYEGSDHLLHDVGVFPDRGIIKRLRCAIQAMSTFTEDNGHSHASAGAGVTDHLWIQGSHMFMTDNVVLLDVYLPDSYYVHDLGATVHRVPREDLSGVVLELLQYEKILSRSEGFHRAQTLFRSKALKYPKNTIPSVANQEQSTGVVVNPEFLVKAGEIATLLGSDSYSIFTEERHLRITGEMKAVDPLRPGRFELRIAGRGTKPLL